MPHSIFGWDLPPGCSINDIPGNRPEDCEQEEMELAFYKNEPDKNGRKRFTDAEWKYLEPKHRTSHLEDIIWKAIEYGMEVGSEKAQEVADENRGYELHFIQEAIDNAKTPEESLAAVKKILFPKEAQ